MSTVAIIQARMDSTRFPGKVLERINGIPMIVWIMKRVGMANVQRMVVATTNRPEDDELCQTLLYFGFGKDHVYRHRGSVDDVLARYADCARDHHVDTVVRITSDCPLVDSDLINASVSEYFRSYGGRPYVSTVAPLSKLPEGLDVEVFSEALLGEANRRASTPPEREHVTSWMRSQDWLGQIAVGARGPLSYSDQHWSVDTPEDLEWVRRVYDYFGVTEYSLSIDWKDVMLAVLAGDLKR